MNKRKKIALFVGLGILLLTLIILTPFCNTYKMDAFVIGKEDGKIILEDFRGEIWEAYSDEYEVNDYVSLEFNTLGTDDIYDDEITGIRGIVCVKEN